MTGTLRQPFIVVTVSGNTPETQPGSGGILQIPFTAPTGYTPVMASCKQTSGQNRFPIWLRQIYSTDVRVMYQNDRTSAATVTIEVDVLCIA